jgi:radical SAM superfamily enzyme YgiQ (UPF0313 family)
MLKIALLQPPVEDFYQTSIRTQPVGLLYLAAALEEAGHQVRIFDFLSSREKRAIPFPKDFHYLKPHFHLGDCSPVRIFRHFYHYGASWATIEQTLAEEPFDIYGITCMFTPFQGQAQQLAEIIRRHFPNRPIVAGGTHATSSPQRLLDTGLFDYVFQGEGEISSPRWVSEWGDCGLRVADCGLLSNADFGMRNAECEVPGVESRGLLFSYQSAFDNNPQSAIRNPQSRIIRNPQSQVVPAERVDSLDALPFPARHLIDLDRYRIDGVRSTMLITSRGCPYRCTFCSVQQTMGHDFRVRSVENVLREIEQCVERFDIRYFDIEDDNFTFDQYRAEQLMTAVLDRFGETLRFSAMNGLTATQLNEGLLLRMRQAGFRQINLSLVASQPQTLRELRRPVSFSGLKRTVEKARNADLECVAYFILGLPGDGRRRMLETLLALAAQPVLIGPSVFYVSPGTELFDALSDHLPKNWDLLRSSTFYMESGSSTVLERVTVFRLTRLLNFLKQRLDTGCWQWESGTAAEWLKESQVTGRKSQVAGRKSQVQPGAVRTCEEIDCTDGPTWPPESAHLYWKSGRPHRVARTDQNIFNTCCDSRGSDGLRLSTFDLRLATCDRHFNLETMLGWAELHLLVRTGKFHAVCRQKPERSYRFVPLPTCEDTVREFFEMSGDFLLRGVKSSRWVNLDEILCAPL